MTWMEWRPIAGFEGLYEVSGLGQVRNARTQQVLVLRPCGAGYLKVNLSTECGLSTTKLAHRLVCIAFHGLPPEGKPEAMHRNDDKTDNRASNLRWGSRRENAVRGSANGSAVLSEEEVGTIRKMRAEGLSYGKIAHSVGVTKRQIINVVKGICWGWLPEGGGAC